MRSRPSTLLEEFASFATEISLAEIPADVVARLKLYLLDQIGVEIAGSGLTRTLMVGEYARQFGRTGPARLVGGTEQLDAEDAALVNAMAGHGLEFDDYCAMAPCHPGCVVVPAVLAMGDQTGATGAEALVALALGYELVTRVALAATPAMVRKRGFHETCAQGVFGSAVVAARLAKAAADETVMSLSLAASHASGIYEFAETGGEVKRLHAGMGAAFGIKSLRLAQLGMTGPRTALEGQKGFLHAFTEGAVPGRIVEGLGSDWKLQFILLREFPVAGSINPAVRALLRIMSEESMSAGDIVGIEVGKELKRKFDNDSWTGPQDLISAQFSPQFVLGLAAVKGTVSFSDFLALESAGFHDPEIELIASAVKVVSDEEALRNYPGRKEAKVTVTVRDGQQWSRREGITADEAPDERFVRRKFIANASGRFPEEHAHRIMVAVDELERLPSIRQLTALLAEPQ